MTEANAAAAPKQPTPTTDAEKLAREQRAKALEGLAVGRIVHHIPRWPGADETDPMQREPHAAIVTKVQDAEQGIVMLLAFPPGTSAGQCWSDVPYSPSGEHGAWRWPQGERNR